jgi:UDP-GlcNAc:undecaprenyl-phosphate/decaprenyl-phosphate GlcNAc-1-phosphate transferase
MTAFAWFILPALIAGALAFALTPLVSRLAVRVGAVDMPGERKVHTTPVPRLGGLAVVTAIAVVFFCAQRLSGGRWAVPPHLAAGLGFGILPILLVSIADDISSVGAHYKLLAHLVGAVIAVSLDISLSPIVHLFGSPIAIGWIAAPLSVLWIVGVTNAFNIIDGLDGLSTGLALISALSMAAVFALVAQPGMAGVSLVLAGALSGFLPYNTHPARLFLGDTGATAIGFCLAVFALRGGSTLSTGFAALLPLFILGLPIADTLLAMVRRMLRRIEHRDGGVFEADRNHIHHRLLALGVEHGSAVLILYAAGLALAAAAFVSVFLNAREAAYMVIAVIMAGLVGVHRLGYDEFAFIRRGTVLRVYEMPAIKRGLFVVFVDLLLAFVSTYLALGLKTDVWSLAALQLPLLEIATTLAPVTVVVFSWRGMYRGSWRVAGLHDLTKVVTSVAIATPAGACLIGLFSPSTYPVSLFAIYAVVNLVITAALRASYVILENSKLRSSNEGLPVLIYGAGRCGVAAVGELFQNQSCGLRPVGFIDDDPAKRGRVINGLPVLGSVREIENALRATSAEGVLVSSHRITPERIERATEACRLAGGNVFRLDISVERIRDGAEPSVNAEPDPVREPAARVLPVSEVFHIDTVMHFGAQPCPSCHAGLANRSKARNAYERFRKLHTHKRLFRCEKCAWRGWTSPLEFGGRGDLQLPPAPDLGALDSTIALDAPLPSFSPSDLT